MRSDGGWLVLLVVVTLSVILPANAVVFYSTGDPYYNTTPPTGALAGSGWELQGDTLSGIPIAPHFFISATHAGGNVGDPFRFRGVDYRIIASFRHPDADITVWEIDGTFPEFASLHSSSDEVGKPLVVFGRGCERGDEIRLNGQLKGWAWGKSDGLLRWGENVVAGITDQDGRPASADTKFQLLRADFDANAGPNESHLSGGDSSGGVFINQGGVWKLAGVTHAANKDYSYTQNGEIFNATLFDETGFYEVIAGQREYRSGDTSVARPGSFYATRISAYLPWIQPIIGSSHSPAIIALEESSSLFGPYTPVPNATIDLSIQAFAVPAPNGTRFYRVLGEKPYVIGGLKKSGEQLFISYK